MRQEVVIPRTLRLLWVVTWGVTYLSFGVGGLAAILRGWPKTAAGDVAVILFGVFVFVLVVLGLLSIAGIPGVSGPVGEISLSGTRVLEGVSIAWHKCANSKHPRLGRVAVLLFGNATNLFVPVSEVVWLFTRSTTLAVLGGGAVLALKLLVSLFAWVWASLSSNLPTVGVLALLDHLWRRRSHKQSPEHKEPPQSS